MAPTSSKKNPHEPLRQDIQFLGRLLGEIIEKQEALIDLLYQEDTASDEMKALKHEVEEKQAVLQKRRDLLPKL